jgi:hypothetical protein
MAPKATFENIRYCAAVGATADMPTVVAANVVSWPIRASPLARAASKSPPRVLF